MTLTRGFLLVIFMASFFFLLPLSYGEERRSGDTGDVVLTPADQMILEAINKMNERIDKVNDRIDKINDRIDNLWITMLGGFLGVMAFIGGIVFWDRRTFLKLARDECRDEINDDRKKIEAMLTAMRKLGAQFPEVREVLSNFGLL